MAAAGKLSPMADRSMLLFRDLSSDIFCLTSFKVTFSFHSLSMENGPQHELSYHSSQNYLTSEPTNILKTQSVPKILQIKLLVVETTNQVGYKLEAKV